MNIEDKVQSIGHQIFYGSRRYLWIRLKRFLSLPEQFIKIVSRDNYTKIKVLQFTSSLPFIRDNSRRVIQNLTEYFSGKRVICLFRVPVIILSKFCKIPIIGKIFVHLSGRLIVCFIERVIAKRFFIGENRKEAMETAGRMKDKGRKITVDVLGDIAHSQEDTDKYVDEYLDLLNEGVDHISLKLTNLYSELDPAAWQRSKQAIKMNLEKIIGLAKEKNAFVTFDMEYFTIKDITVEIFLDILKETEFDNFSIAIQTYFKGKESLRDLERIITFSRELNADRSRDKLIIPGVRLVKGANWDKDMAEAVQNGWPCPHYENKSETDISFEEGALYLLENIEYVRPYFATHNIRSMAWVIAQAEEHGISKGRFEFQFLYGMIPEEIVCMVDKLGYNVRFYAPYGAFLAGLGYLVRRILENSSSDSFIHNLHYTEKSINELLLDPRKIPHKQGPVMSGYEKRDVSDHCQISEDINTGLKNLERISHAILREPLPSVFSDRKEEVSGIFLEYRDQMSNFAQRAMQSVESLAGRENEYRYIPRGKGIVIIEDRNLSLSQIAVRFAAPLAGGNTVFISIEDQNAADYFKGVFQRAKIDAGCIEFLFSSKDKNEEHVQKRDLDWISYTGDEERKKHFRRLCYKDLDGDRTVKRFIFGITPFYLKEFIMAKTIAENTMRKGCVGDYQNIGGLKGFNNIPSVELYRPQNQKKMQEALETINETYNANRVYPLIIGGEKIETEDLHDSINPAEPRVSLGRVCFAVGDDVNKAVDAAKAACGEWSASAVEQRAEVLKKAAEILTGRRFELAALITAESGKAQEEALPEVDETIDFLNYYAIDAVRIQDDDSAIIHNERWKGYERQPYGVTAVIAPWNFPLSILTGMTAGALVMGNTVIMKPSEWTSVTAYELEEIFRDAGVPDGVLNYLPGKGELIGEALVSHPRVDMVVFTGSKETGLRIKNRAEENTAGRKDPKVVIAEMGGKNVIIIDDDADIDEAVEGVVASAFGYSGQKCSACSRVIILPGIRNVFEQKLKAKFQSMVIGNPCYDPGVRVGPLIDKEARKKVEYYLKIAGEEDLELLISRQIQSSGNSERSDLYVDPVMYIISNVKQSRLAQEEIFGPVLSLIYAKDFDEALKIANDTEFALTGGVYSQTPSHIQRAKEEFFVGNLYINQKITGAVVGRQPFGGYKKSGIGAKT
ncbi:MAG: bifunctional proline dehydrogenase/L-glutamate gamma-semialdehyde dehydrogenase, partial [Candidatus Omnitrophota bacterium]